MKKYTVYGNCQARIIPSVLGSSKCFKESFEYVDVKAVHHMKQQDIEYLIETVLPSLDLFIFQPVSRAGNDNLATEYLLTKLNPDCTRISFPSNYFKGYNPELMYLKDENEVSMIDIFDYHDKNLIKYFLLNSIDKLSVDMLDPNFYDEKLSLDFVEGSLLEMESRENDIFGTGKKIDIKVSQFVRDNYQKDRLFYTINHPSNALFNYIGKRILETLDIDDQISFHKDPLSHTIYPIYESHYKNLKLEFDNPLRYRIKGEELNMAFAISKYCDYYSVLPQRILEINAN